MEGIESNENCSSCTKLRNGLCHKNHRKVTYISNPENHGCDEWAISIAEYNNQLNKTS